MTTVQGPLGFKKLDKKTLLGVLLQQGIEVPFDFFDSPQKGDALLFLEQLVCLFMGFGVRIATKEDLRVVLTEYAFKLPRGSLTPEHPLVQKFPVSLFLPDEGERHVAGTSIVVLYRYLQQFGHICGIHDVSLSDIFHPTAERMRLFASAITDYIRFQETHLPEALKKWEAVKRGRAEVDLLMEQTRQYRDAEQQIAADLAARSNEIASLRAEKEQVTVTLTRLGEKWVKVKEECDSISDEHKAAEDQLRHREARLVELNNEIRVMKSQIVNSPERIQRTLEDYEKQLNQADEDLRGISQNIPRMQMEHLLLEKLQRRLEEARELLGELEMRYENMQEITNKEETLKEALEKATVARSHVAKELQSLRITHQQSVKELEDLKALIARDEDAFRKDVETSRCEALEVRRTLEELQQEVQTLEKNVAAAQARCSEIDKEIEKVELLGNQMLAQLQSKVHRLTRKLLSNLRTTQESALGSKEDCDVLAQIKQLLGVQNSDIKTTNVVDEQKISKRVENTSSEQNGQESRQNEKLAARPYIHNVEGTKQKGSENNALLYEKPERKCTDRIQRKDKYEESGKFGGLQEAK